LAPLLAECGLPVGGQGEQGAVRAVEPQHALDDLGRRRARAARVPDRLGQGKDQEAGPGGLDGQHRRIQESLRQPRADEGTDLLQDSGIGSLPVLR
jgi:hypothetical protein